MNRLRAFITAFTLLMAFVVGPTFGLMADWDNGYEYEWQEEWYDPSDWFDDDQGAYDWDWNEDFYYDGLYGGGDMYDEEPYEDNGWYDDDDDWDDNQEMYDDDDYSYDYYTDDWYDEDVDFERW